MLADPAVVLVLVFVPEALAAADDAEDVDDVAVSMVDNLCDDD